MKFLPLLVTVPYAIDPQCVQVQRAVCLIVDILMPLDCNFLGRDNPLKERYRSVIAYKLCELNTCLVLLNTRSV